MADQGNKADMMGSRADMISMKIDEVARNQIWREHLVKESKLEGPITGFQFNPNTGRLHRRGSGHCLIS